MEWHEDTIQYETAEWGYEEVEDEEEYGAPYGGEAMEWSAPEYLNFDSAPRCWNGPNCKFLAMGTCQYYHPPDDLEWSPEAAPAPAASPNPKRVQSKKEGDIRKKWNQLVNKGGSAEAMKPLGNNRESTEGSGTSSSTSRSRSPSRTGRLRPHRDGRLVATPSLHPAAAGRVQLTPAPGSMVKAALPQSDEILAPPPGVW
mmetsp:Transcript_30758/g.70538  ORF Transcript_30758/g.70538 Transcript_30758/m.70538 type:complete len:200 (+) Transcript_30758:143-742(+)